MKIVYFTHSLASCWNHGNAHFLRGVLRDLLSRGHDVRVFEPSHAWSLQNLLADHREAGLKAYRAAYPDLTSTSFGPDFDPHEALDGAAAETQIPANTEQVADAIFGQYVVPFEAVSVLLLAALVGAIVLARKD